MKTNLVPAAILAAMMATPVAAGGHSEFGHWVVTSDKREQQFYDCVEHGQPEMDPVLKDCLDRHDRGEAKPGECDAGMEQNMVASLNRPCLAKLRNPKVRK